MRAMIEVRFHGRGGQGVVTAAHILADAIFRSQRFVQMIPIYGGERRGAPVTAFLRIDDEPIRITSQVENPDCVVVFDPLLPKMTDIEAGLKTEGVAVLNETKPPEELRLYTRLSKIATVDATDIAVEVFGRTAIPITGTVMVGAFTACTGWADPSLLLEVVRNRFPGEMGEKNVRAVKMGLEKTRVRNL